MFLLTVSLKYISKIVGSELGMNQSHMTIAKLDLIILEVQANEGHRIDQIEILIVKGWNDVLTGIFLFIRVVKRMKTIVSYICRLKLVPQDNLLIIDCHFSSKYLN
jgi:hypothetical protein